MSKIVVKGRSKAKGGDIARFEAWARELVAKIRDDDPGTLAFGVYPAGDGEYVFLEVYKDSAAAIAHLQNVGPLLQRMGDVTDPSDQPLEVYGDLSDELRALYAPWSPVILVPIEHC